MTESKEVKGYLAVLSEERDIVMKQKHPELLKQEFKGSVDDVEETFPKNLGAKHPFDIAKIEKVVDSVGLVNSSVDKITDYIIGDFTIETNDTKTQTLLDSFIDDSNLLIHLRAWIKEAISKGNGYMDLSDIENDKLQTLNANNMYVRRNKKGKVLEYNQFIGRKNIHRAVIKPEEVNKFSPNEIAHLLINEDPGEPYGIGLVHPNEAIINNYMGAEVSLHQLMDRKAGAPIHVKVGQPGESVQAGDVDSVKSSLQYMNNRTEWVTDGNIEMNVLDFQNVGNNLTELSKHDIEQLAMGMQIPMVLMGVANVPEGLAKEQSKAFKRFIESIRRVIEDIIESRILRIKLQSQGLDSKVEFLWELPTDEDKMAMMSQLNIALSNGFISPELRAALEIEYAQTLGLQELVDILKKPQEAQQEEEVRRQEEEEITQPEVPGEKPTAQEKQEVEITESEKVVDIKKQFTEEELNNMPVSEYVNITELAGFNYSDYLVKILNNVRAYQFPELKAITENDILEGLLPQKDVDKLRVVIKDGFKKNKTIRQIEGDISNSIDLKDRVKIQEDGTTKLTATKETRPLMIARTETVRLANLGLKDLYKENGIKKYRYLAAMDERTSDICQSLNGQVFNMEDFSPGNNAPPMHTNCRSTTIALVEGLS